jgi:uncharacterized protein
MPTIVSTPTRVMGLYDKPMWDSIEAGRMRLQRCKSNGKFHYPPGPMFPDCPADELEWADIAGRGTIISWIVFHRQYLPAYPVPYNVIAVRLEEGPVIISNLEGECPEGSWIGRSVKLIYVRMPDGVTLPRFKLA